MARTILVIDDERNMRWVLERALSKAGYEVVTAERGEVGLQSFARHAVDLVLLDLKMPGMDGMTVLRELRKRDTTVPVLLLTAYAAVPTAVEALQIGANDYLRKPFDIETVLATINRYLAASSDAAAANRTTLPASTADPFTEFVGAAPSLQPALSRARAALESPYPVIVRGESGTGRRHLAQLIHSGTAATREHTFVELDCANLPAAVLTHELLSETTDDDSGGRWQQALGGTLLLSNVEMLPEDIAQRATEFLAQYLLSTERPHGLRLLLTTSITLSCPWNDISAFAFDIQLPPLRERMDDIVLLLRYFVPEADWDKQALAQLMAFDWPGNVTELQRIVSQAERLAVGNKIKPTHLPSQLHGTDSQVAGIFVLPPEGISLDRVEEDLIRQALAMATGNKTRAARLLGLSRATLLYRIDKYDISTTEPEIADSPDGAA